MSVKSNPATGSQAAGSNSSETLSVSATAPNTRGRSGVAAGSAPASAGGADGGCQGGAGGGQPFLLQALALLPGPVEEGVEVDGAQRLDVVGHFLQRRPEAELPVED